MMKYIYILSITILSISCTNKINENTDGKIIENKYASKFEISKIEEGYILKVSDRFDDSNSKTQDYLLSSNSEYESNNNIIIHIPVMNVVCLSSTHSAFISQLGKTQSIKGVSGTDYLYNDEIRTLIKNNKITDIGYDNQVNIEKIISLNPDVVFAFGIDNSNMASYQKLTEIGIPIVFVGDFLETNPLGRTEWIKFFACFYDNLDYATEYFDSVEGNYNLIKESISKNEQEKEKILVNLPWKGTWWIPGGNSYFANFIKDAGGTYFLSDNSSQESIPLSIEEVYADAADCKIWLNTNSAENKRQIIKIDSRLADFKPINHRIFNNNKRINKYGGNDFYESGILHPDIILKDLNFIIKNKKDSDHELYYYKEIK